MMHNHRTLSWICAVAWPTIAACSASVEQGTRTKGGAAAASATSGISGAAGKGTQSAVGGLFPGAGSSQAAAPLPAGSICDAVGAQNSTVSPSTAECFFGSSDPGYAVALLEQVLECAQDGVSNTVHIRLTFNPEFVDNTYGSGSIGWPHNRGHRFRDLVKSDHAEILMNDAQGENVLRFKLDYFSEDPRRASGYGSLGVLGGDGSMLLGPSSALLEWTSSQDRNFNQRGYGRYTVDSPATDADYAPNPAAPDWDYRVVYEAWIDADVFGARGFGGASIEHVHASPAKGGGDTVTVTPGECPPPIDSCTDGIPDTYCATGEPPTGDDPCADGSPDTFCNTGSPPGPPETHDSCDDDVPDNDCASGGPPPDPDPDLCAEAPDDPRCLPPN
jgi:hypothetical protein